ncbi:MAG: epoxyqueuosine reductase QueH [Bacteroidales bacterium]|nr:epoxyqueuosine reductase QueH [Bacteroidales bacterium]MCM1146730.1 epoxyqueuosine reductase QueH [Bacteroidales bacterium]MCM1205547.1 epoxyqueuosine reductase QueH [Bacillota bacterium]MCM1509191.1 epoxyqueuosine reductase QueH [Clostridium sp.]
MTETLLHCCCAPCSSAILEWMLHHDVRPTLYYCNPNIYPEKEYIIRKNELTRYAGELGLRVIDDDHHPDWQGWERYHKDWLNTICGLEDEPERGRRCLKCFKLRLLRTAQIAKEEGFETFTTTLASSRWKSLEQINEAGLWAAEQVNNGYRYEQENGTHEQCAEAAAVSSPATHKKTAVSFDTRNWRKGGLQERRNQLLKEIGFYNQQYCGCEFSLEAMKRKTAAMEYCKAETDGSAAASEQAGLQTKSI